MEQLKATYSGGKKYLKNVESFNYNFIKSSNTIFNEYHILQYLHLDVR